MAAAAARRDRTARAGPPRPGPGTAGREHPRRAPDPAHPLPPSDIEQIFGRTVGVPPGATLRSLAPLAAGNPLYARELVSGLVAEDGVRVVDGLAEVDARADEMRARCWTPCGPASTTSPVPGSRCVTPPCSATSSPSPRSRRSPVGRRST
ncbi:hypothetical protein V2I01_32525 [Micromonospora sp. BRA006-A]|nr:hypothetical protein [Micromonospora sp. BRA006-A]